MLSGASGSLGAISSTLLPPGGWHMPTWAPSSGTVRADMSFTYMPKTEWKVSTATKYSAAVMAMAIRGSPVIMLKPCRCGVANAIASAVSRI